MARKLLTLVVEGVEHDFAGPHQFGKYRHWKALSVLFSDDPVYKAHRNWMRSLWPRAQRGEMHPQLRWMVRVLAVKQELVHLPDEKYSDQPRERRCRR